MTTDRKILIFAAAIACAWIAMGTPYPAGNPAPAPQPVEVAPDIESIISTDTATAAALAEFYADAAAILPDAVATNGQLRQALQKSTRFYFPTIGTAGQYPGYAEAISDFLTGKLGSDPESYDPETTRAALQSLETIHR